MLRVKSRPYVFVGWFWFLGTLAPVIGLLQVGSQAMADRYTYVPHIGLFMAAAWIVWEWAGESTHRKRVLVCGGVAAVAAFGVAASVQVRYWRDSETLFRRALAVTSATSV